MLESSNRTVFFVSESTGITAETMGHSLLSQFPHLDFTYIQRPFVDTETKAAISYLRPPLMLNAYAKFAKSVVHQVDMPRLILAKVKLKSHNNSMINMA